MKKFDLHNIAILYENAKREPVLEVSGDGTKRWRIGNKHHREDGPAIEWDNGTKVWCINGNVHRIDGPAVEYANGNKSWYLNGGLYDNVYQWAWAALIYQKLPADKNAVKQYVQKVLNKQVDEEI